MTALVRLEGTTPVSLSLPPDLSYEEWRDTGLAYAKLGKAIQFWMGDWLLHGEQHFGELMAQAASETGYSEESLRGFLWVSSRIPPPVRRSTLSWSHHQVVAGQDNAAALLEAAETNSWSVSELRVVVRGPPKPKALCGNPECPLLNKEEA